MNIRKIATVFLVELICFSATAQRELSKEQILNMTTEQLSELSLEDLMQAVETLGVSSVDELFALIMNKSVSSASKQNEDSFTSPLATTVITRDELRTYGATTIEDAFRLIPGMIVTQKFNGVYDIHMRGLNNLPDNNTLLYTENNNTLLMVDGRIVNNYITGAMQMERLPISIEDVERIEVVRGACSALYGMNAVNGVINIITEKPSADSKKVSGAIQMGNNNTAITDVALRTNINDKWSVGLTVNAQYRQRPTSDIYLAPQLDLYHANSKAAYNSCTNLQGGTSNEERWNVINSNATAVPSTGGFYSLEYLNQLFKIQDEMNYTTYESKVYSYKLFEDYATIYDRFSDSKLARRNFGINGYVSFAPTPEIHFDLSGGYQNSYIMTNPILYAPITMAGQTSKTGYVNLDATVKDLHMLVNYSAGPQNLYYGFPGAKVNGQNINAQAEYDINVGDLSIRPAVAWQYLYYKDYENYYNGEKLSGLFNDDADLTTISPSLRLDYKLDTWRFVAGIRGDKTSAPDKWDLSWQAEISKQLNEKNFVRAVYGRSYRAPNMLNTATSLVWDRTGMTAPSEMNLIGSTDADLMQIDNFEIGYRFRPTPTILLDAEVYYSHSHDYGALMSTNSAYFMTTENFMSSISNMSGNGNGNGNGGNGSGTPPDDGGEGGMTPPNGGEGGIPSGEGGGEQNVYDQISRSVSSMLRNNCGTISNMVYKNLPYEVQQYGLSLNLDWIVSPKLIFKVNANVQQTLVNDYYEYNMNASLYNQMDLARQNTSACLYELLEGYSTNGNAYLGAALQKANLDEFLANSGYSSWTWEQTSGFQDALIEAYQSDPNNPKTITYNGYTYTGYPLALYYGLEYNVHQVTTADGAVRYEIGESSEAEHALINKHKHQATPSVYGMIGCIFKPTQNITISTYGNYMHHRTYNTTYSNVMKQAASSLVWWRTVDMGDGTTISDKDVVDWEIYSEEERDALIAKSDKFNEFANSTNKLHSRFTLNMKVGYKPISSCEFFLNAQNLLNTNFQEAIFCDKIGGLYTVGLNFAF